MQSLNLLDLCGKRAVVGDTAVHFDVRNDITGGAKNAVYHIGQWPRAMEVAVDAARIFGGYVVFIF